MHLSTESASDADLLDRVMDNGIVVEIWDKMGAAGIDLTGVVVTISALHLFAKGRNPPFRAGHFWKVEPS